METKTINEVSVSAYMFEDGLKNKVSGDKLNIITDWVNFYYCPKFQIINVFVNDDDKLYQVLTELDELYSNEFKEIAKKFKLEQIPLVKSYTNKDGNTSKFIKFNLKRCLIFDDTGKRIPLTEELKGYQVRISFFINSYNMNKSYGVSLRPIQIQLRKRPTQIEKEESICLFD